MMEYLESNEVMNPNQHGLKHNIQQSFGDDFGAIYQDFSKAFGKVGHNILLHKRKALKFTEKILKCLKSFVKKRLERVKENGHLWDWVWMLPGFLQRSVPGPQFCPNTNDWHWQRHTIC